MCKGLFSVQPGEFRMLSPNFSLKQEGRQTRMQGCCFGCKTVKYKGRKKYGKSVTVKNEEDNWAANERE